MNPAPELFEQKMSGLAPCVARAFARYYAQLTEGSAGLVSESTVRPVPQGGLPDSQTLGEYAEQGRQSLRHTAIVKLNGGLGTSMGLDMPKSLLTVRDGLSFLDVTVKHILHLNDALGIRMPMVLMNSFSTEQQSLDALAPYRDELDSGLPFSFLQNKFPKVLKDSLEPAQWPKDPLLEWNPPGHGDIYTALSGSGMLDKLLERDIRYAFVSNVDNLGAVPDVSILGYFAFCGGAFMMEAADRTAMDRKGGHLARSGDGGLVLRESAQCPPDEMEKFQDIQRYCYFNTNNIWLNLPRLKEYLDKHDGVVGLPLIRNEKHLDPRDSESPKVYQLESAMGAAIGVLPDSSAIRVPRSRFLPVKKCDDLLILRSDCYSLDSTFAIRPNPARKGSDPVVSLDPAFYGRIDQFEQRFPHGAPSMVGCESLSVRGDCIFAKDVKLEGTVALENGEEKQLRIE